MPISLFYSTRQTLITQTFYNKLLPSTTKHIRITFPQHLNKKLFEKHEHLHKIVNKKSKNIFVFCIYKHNYNKACFKTQSVVGG